MGAKHCEVRNVHTIFPCVEQKESIQFNLAEQGMWCGGGKGWETRLDAGIGESGGGIRIRQLDDLCRIWIGRCV